MQKLKTSISVFILLFAGCFILSFASISRGVALYDEYGIHNNSDPFPMYIMILSIIGILIGVISLRQISKSNSI